MIKDSFIISEIPIDIIKSAINNTNDSPKVKTSNTISNGFIGDKFFYKMLNSEKIRMLFKGNYISLWKENYEALNKLIPLNRIYGIIELKDGRIYEFSQRIDEDKFLSGGTIHKWNRLEELYQNILNYINRLIQYQSINNNLIGVETAIWNFTIDGKLFDLDPPRLLRRNENSSFTRKDDINQSKRTIYRNFTEIGMKTNLLATIIIGLQDGNFSIPDLPENWINILINHLTHSINDEKKRKVLEMILNGNLAFKADFTKHPIDIILKGKNKNKVGGITMKKENKEQQFIFVTGPSESGKSGGINHIKAKYQQVKHLKIRDIFPAVYRDSGSNLPYDQWYENESKNNFKDFWDKYIEKAKEMSDGADIVIMDTMYGVKEIQYLYKKLQQHVGVLYIDAPEEERIKREYQRLRTDSPYTDRKADLSITMEQVAERTKRKDAKKKRLETFEYKDLAYEQDGTLVVRKNGIKFSKVINNDGTVDELYDKLDSYIEGEIAKVKSRKEKEQEER